MKYQSERFSKVVDEVVRHWPAHWNEIGVDRDKLDLAPDWDQLFSLEKINALHLVTARHEGELVGYFMFVLSPHLQHRSTLHATSVLYYLDPKWRKGFTAVMFFRFASESLKERGVSRVIVDVPVESDKSRLFERLGFTKIANSYAKFLDGETRWAQVQVAI